MGVAIGTNSGFVSSAPSGNPAGSGNKFNTYVNAQKDTSPTGSYAVSSMGWYCSGNTEAANFQVGLYSHDAANNRPNALLASSGDLAKGTTQGWKTGSVSYTLSSATTYWCAAQLDDTATQTNMDYSVDAGQKWDYKTPVTELPSSWGTSTGTNGVVFALYALYAAAASAIAPASTWHGVNLGFNLGIQRHL